MENLILGRRYTMPDGVVGKYLGVNHGTHADYYCFRLAGAKFAAAKLTESQTPGAVPRV